MSQQLFDQYDRSYGDVVQGSIDFSGLKHDFFLQAKADLMREKIAAHFGMKKPDGLDLGCGVGAFHPYVRNYFARYCGVDISEKSIEQAKAARSDVEYAAHDGAQIPHADSSFDFVSAICVMHHVPPAQWSSFMREMRRVIRPGGIVCVIEHNPWNPLTRLAVNRCEFDADAVLLRAGKTEALMQETGLRNIESDFFLMLPWQHKAARAVERAFSFAPLGAQYMTCGEVK
ncbi:MAG: class I SAM-dependent methyltransferase [Xanthobacteraceae bacterium]|nr:class I SAM-dependent methyltransferase [Xanthobacteraceae bacterium]